MAPAQAALGCRTLKSVTSQKGKLQGATTCLLWATALRGRSKAHVFLPPDKDYLISQTQA